MTQTLTEPMPATVAELTDAWAEAMADVRAVSDDLGEGGWRHPSLLPGWSVADVVAHLTWIERILLGRFDAPHEPDWSALPHATSAFGRATEIPVDLRRARGRADVLAEFDTTIADRLQALRQGPQDLATPTPDAFGRPSTLDGVLRMRIFDTWVHSQDIRLAVGRPGGTGTAAARIAAERMAGALGFVWARNVAAPEDTTLVLDVVGPAWSLRRAVVRQADGRGRAIDAPESPTAHLTMTLDDFVQLSCGRVRPNRSLPEAAAAVRIEGDQDLGTRAVQALMITP